MANTFDYQDISAKLLASLPKTRDVDVLTRRYGLGLEGYETLDAVGKRYGITRERVRQIERAALKRLNQTASGEVGALNKRLVTILEKEGKLAPLNKLAKKLGASGSEFAYINFLAHVAPEVGVIDDNRQFRSTVYLHQSFTPSKLSDLSQELVDAFKRLGQPARLTEISSTFKSKLTPPAIENLALITKALANFDNIWGLQTWPQVNPRSIRDRAYLALHKHTEPLHYSDIAVHIDTITPSGRKVTTQAVHNELIKDGRFVLIGRGIYALADWGYSAGTVADIIKEVLREQQPLHKDEIVKRVLKKRQVKTTTIALNLQEKDYFLRVSKAVYKLKG